MLIYFLKLLLNTKIKAQSCLCFLFIGNYCEDFEFILCSVLVVLKKKL